jgi:GR25 family glycosyltransferase involved in LPS biosynthesis
MLHDIPILVLNCAKDVERRAYVEKQLSLYNLKYEVFTGTDGAETPNSVFEQENIVYNHVGVNGCSLSHKRIWQYIVDKNYQEVLVLEDDIVFCDNFEQLYKKFKPMTYHDYGIIFLGYVCMDGPANQDHVFTGHPLATHAYIITNKACRWYLENFGECCGPIDIHMRDLYHNKGATRDWVSYYWWHGEHIDLSKQETRLNCFFRGIVFQNHDIHLAIHSRNNL